MPLVYGFRMYPPRAAIYAHPFSGVAIATPALDLLMRQDNLYVPDRSGYGNNGLCVRCLGAQALFDGGQKFDGLATQYIDCGSAASLDITQDISAGAWVYSRGGLLENVMAKADGVANGWALFVNGFGQVMAYFYAGGGAFVAGANSVRKGWSHVWMSVKSNVCRVFADGLQEARGAVTMSDFAAGSLVLSWPTFPFTGTQELDQVFSGALSPEQIYRKYLEARDVPIYLDDFSSYPVDPAPKAAGAMCGPFRVYDGTHQVTVDAAGKHWVSRVTAGTVGRQVEGAYGLWEFDFNVTLPADILIALMASVFGPAAVSAAQNGYWLHVNVNGAIIAYLVTAGGVAAMGFGSVNGVVASATDYSLRVVRRAGGQFALYIKGGAYPDWTLIGPAASGSNPFVDNTHTTATWFGATFSATAQKISNIKRLVVCERPASFPWEFLSGTWAGIVSGTTVWARCIIAGALFTPKDLDWQTMVCKLYKGADANVTDLLFVASEIGNTLVATQNGYCLRLAADESVKLLRVSGGIETELATTAAAYVALTTEYEFKITRVWWTLMFGATLGIYTASNFTNWDLDADDRATAPTYYHDIR
jgi:hypothetical protein